MSLTNIRTLNFILCKIYYIFKQKVKKKGLQFRSRHPPKFGSRYGPDLLECFIKNYTRKNANFVYSDMYFYNDC